MFGMFIRFRPVFYRTLALLLWMSVIFFFSAMPGSEIQSEPTLAYYLERKGAHVAEYALLMLLVVRFFTAIFPKESFPRITLVSFAFCVAYAASDELHQLFVPYRGGKLTDVLIDTAGALSMTLFLFILKGGDRWKASSKKPR